MSSKSFSDCIWNGSIPKEWYLIVVAVMTVVILAVMLSFVYYERHCGYYTCVPRLFYFLVLFLFIFLIGGMRDVFALAILLFVLWIFFVVTAGLYSYCTGNRIK